MAAHRKSIGFLRLFSIFLVPLLFSCSAQAQKSGGSPPSVFLITIDTLRADHVHCYGDQQIETPALDSLAAAGIRFDNAFTPAPITSASHASILTGLQPSSHGVTDFGVSLSPEHATWGQLLKARHYQTAAFIGAVVLDSKTLAPGFDRGFDFYDSFPDSSDPKAHWGRVERRAETVVAHAEKWLAAHPQGPVFAWVHLYDPHDPYEPPAPFSQKYANRLYDGEIAYADFALQRFLGFLKQTHRYQNALIVVVGDHGEGLGEHNEETHGIFLYDSTTHVPLIIKLPQSADASKVVAAQVRTTDILPTVLDTLGIGIPAAVEGKSLRPLLDGGESGERIVFGETDYPVRFGWAPLRSIREEHFKFIEAPKPELYDLSGDPRELKNAYQPWDDRVKKLRATLAEERAHAHASTTAATVGTGTLEELRALGYLGRADVGSATNVPEPSLLPDPKDKIEEQNLLHRAMMANESGRTADALEALRKAIQLDPGFFEAQRQLGEMELQAGRFTEAAEHLKRAHDLQPQDAQTAFEAGRALIKSGDMPGAREILEAGLKRSPENAPARMMLADVYLNAKDIPSALDQLQAAALLQPESPEVHEALAAAYRASGDMAKGQAEDARAKAIRGASAPRK
jgi:arylsulfatase A-like enzyme/Tfp pilus assembly protein PilF